jgi:nucleoside 2-deoxyribosyltransferase
MTRADIILSIKELADPAPCEPIRIYLAAPYLSRGLTKEWENLRVTAVNIAAMRLIRAGFVVFSPISHSDPISKAQDDKYNTHALWLSQDEKFMEWADVLVILELPGVYQSFGVQWERTWFAKHDKPESWITLEDVYNMELEEEH